MTRTSIALALLLLAAEAVGFFVFKRVEAATILCGIALVTFACWRVRWTDAAEPFVLLVRGAAIVLGAAVAIAGAFDLLDLGRSTVRGDWDTGFLVAVALLLPSTLVYGWMMHRPAVTAPADIDNRLSSLADRSIERATAALFVASVAGVFAGIAIDDRSPLGVALVAGVCGVAAGLVSVVHQALMRQRATRLQFFVEMTAGFALACALMVDTVLGGLFPVFVATCPPITGPG